MAQNYTVDIVDYQGLAPQLQADSGKLLVVNFWATWCKPCVRELPLFEALNQESAVEVILVSLDFKRNYESHLLPFIQQNNLLSRVVMLDDPDANQWIDKVDPDWSGAIPATLFLSSHQRRFFEGEISSETLNRIVNQLIVKP